MTGPGMWKAQPASNRGRSSDSILEGLSYSDVFNSLMDGFAVVDMSGTIIESNEAFRAMLGYDRGEISLLNYNDITPAAWHELEARIVSEQVLVRGYSEVYEKEYRSKDGLVFPVELRTCLFRDAEGSPKGMWAIVRNVSARKRTESRLQESEERFRRVFEGAAIGMALIDPSGRFIMVNRALAAMLGYAEDELLDLDFLDLTHPDDRDVAWDNHLELIAGARESFQIEKRYIRKDGVAIWGRLNASALRGRGEAGRDLVLGLVEDITLRKAQEARIERSLDENAVLLKEVHHRVKNNLQLVASLLALQISYLPMGPEGDVIRGILSDASGRVRSLANIHEIVYSTRDFAGLDFATYMESIARETAYSMSAEPISLELRLQEVRMDLDTAIPCGLLVNEAMTNIAKHAYPRGWQGPRKARLSLEPRADGIARIVIEDEGVGLPASGSAEGLGFTVMRALADQVDGRLAFRSEGGTIVEFEV